eukprot:g4274.t1
MSSAPSLTTDDVIQALDLKHFAGINALIAHNDPKQAAVWMTNLGQHKKEDDIKDWHIIYPAYVDKELKRSQGRRVALTDACENPTIQDIYSLCAKLKVEAIMEWRSYPRQWWNPGRVRVDLTPRDDYDLKDPDTNEVFLDKKTLLKRLGQLLPKWKELNKNKKPNKSNLVDGLNTPDDGGNTGGGRKKGKKGKKGKKKRR